MNLRRFRSEEPEIILIPFIDVLLMLLIFFMLTTTFERATSLRVDLPKVETGQQSQPEEPLALVVSADGRYFINGQEVVNSRTETLVKALKSVVAGRKDPHLEIRAAAMATNQSVVTAMDAAGQAGITRLSLATLQAGHGH